MCFSLSFNSHCQYNLQSSLLSFSCWFGLGLTWFSRNDYWSSSSSSNCVCQEQKSHTFYKFNPSLPVHKLVSRNLFANLSSHRWRCCRTLVGAGKFKSLHHLICSRAGSFFVLSIFALNCKLLWYTWDNILLLFSLLWFRFSAGLTC